MKYKGLDLYEWFIGDNEDGINALSLVDEPAIKKDWVALSKQKEVVRFATVDGDKQLLVALMLLPEAPIYRKFGDVEMYVYVSEDTIQLISEDFLKKGNQAKITAMHQELLSGIVLTQSWLVEDPKMDKINLYNLDAPKGSWAGVLKVENKEIWDEYIKTGILKGVSVEGLLSTREGTNFKGVDLSDDETVSELQQLLNKI